MFTTFIIGYPFIYRNFLFLTKYVQSRLLQNCRMRERDRELLTETGLIIHLQPIPQYGMIFYISVADDFRKILRVYFTLMTFENIAIKVEIAQNKQFRLKLQYFQLFVKK